MRPASLLARTHSIVLLLLALGFLASAHSIYAAASPSDRLRLIIETDAGGDPDDEQSLVRFLLYVNEWDVEGIIANRAETREGENLNTERTGLGITRQMLRAYGQCWTNLLRHNSHYPSQDQLWLCTVAGYNDTEAAVELLIAAADRPDPRPIWYSDWGTDSGGATNNLLRALRRVLRERGPQGYAQFKQRFRLASGHAVEPAATNDPPFSFWVDTFRPPLNGLRWYHRFSALTSTAGGFDIERDARTGHGTLGALYPLNTTHPQKEGDTMTFLYLVPTGMNDPNQPGWGSWGGRYGLNTNDAGRAYFWANQFDGWQGVTNRDNTVARWAVALQNDFRARLNWCVATDFRQANHPPTAVLNDDTSKRILELRAHAGERLTLSAAGSRDPDGQEITTTWFIYREAGTFQGEAKLMEVGGQTTALLVPETKQSGTVHVILQVEDSGEPHLFAWRRAVVRVDPR